MANLTESAVYDAGVYQIETTDPVSGGATGIANKPLINLANRTAFLKGKVDGILAGTEALTGYAKLASPSFTGNPLAPTPALGDNDTSIATTNFVQKTLGGVLSKSVAGGVNVTLTAVEAGNGILVFTGALTASISVIVPTAPTRPWVVFNNTTGAFTLTVKTASGTGVLVPQGKREIVYCDGTNVASAFTDFVDVALEGAPTAPTAAVGTNTTQLATTAFVNAEIANDAAPKSHVSATGAAHGVATTSVNGFMSSADKTKLDGIASGAAALGSTAGAALGTAAAGTATTAARSDHVHPTDTTRAPLASPTFTGTPAAPTAAAGTNTTQLATTAFVQTAVGAVTSPVTSVAGKTGAVTLTASDVGLVNVANVDQRNASNLTSGTVPDARLTGTYSGFTHKIDGANSVFTTPNSGSTSTAARTVYGLAEYKSDSGTQVGAIVFIAPNTSSTIMHQLEVHGMLYNQNIFSVVVQGYRTTGAWSDTRKISTGTVDVQTRWGVTPDGKNCLILGDVGTSWSYPHLAIVRAMFSHSGVTDAYCTGWTVAVVTNLSLYTNITATIADSAMVGSVSGNAATATTLQTARTINGVLFNGSANITVADSTKLPLAGGTMTGAIGFAASQTWPTFNQNTTGSAAKLATARTFTIGSTDKTFNGSANVAWTLAEIGAAASSHTHDAGDIATGTFAAARLPAGSTSAAGIVKLSSSINSTSTALAATASAVKEAYDAAMSDDAVSKATNGYVKLRSGLIIQWGVANAGDPGITVTFPVAFPTACRAVTATYGQAGDKISLGAHTFTTTTFKLSGWDYSAYWIAVGY